eukprot:350660-Chlamydomonas_euryale.AAC.11
MHGMQWTSCSYVLSWHRLHACPHRHMREHSGLMLTSLADKFSTSAHERGTRTKYAKDRPAATSSDAWRRAAGGHTPVWPPASPLLRPSQATLFSSVLYAPPRTGGSAPCPRCPRISRKKERYSASAWER